MSGWVMFLACVVVACASAQTSGPAAPLAITSTEVPAAKLRQMYSYELRAREGTPPYTWRVSGGSLPPGMTLDARTGRITGSASAVGESHFTITVSDASRPPQSAAREFVLKVVAPLTVQWKAYPRVEGNNSIRGSARVMNGTDQAFDLTFIVVAVNEIGKAFALGYQHFTLPPESTSPLLEFGSTLPAGQYIVHVDAVAEDAPQNKIYRARLQTSTPLELSGLP